MRVRAKPPRSTSAIQIDLPSLPAGVAPKDDQPSGLAAQRVGAPELPTTRSPVRILIILLAFLIAAVVIGALISEVGKPSGSVTLPTPLPSTSAPSSEPPTSRPTLTSPTQSGEPTPTGTRTLTETPTPTEITSTPTPVDTRPETTPTSADSTAWWPWALLALLGLAFVIVMMTRGSLAARRRGGRKGTRRVPHGEPTADLGLLTGQPRASLGTPDVLILTESATPGDTRLHERLKDPQAAIFANLQLACSFYPTDDWEFSSARLTVILAREDGRTAPAPIAYSLLPLSDRDGTARERSVEIGADMKLLSVKGGEKAMITGHEFVRGYGLQESVSYWAFTATPAQPLEGSFLLWLIARAPTDSDLVVTSSLDVWVRPRRIWSRTDIPPVTGTGRVSLLVGLKNGPPYTARLRGPAAHTSQETWAVDVR